MSILDAYPRKRKEQDEEDYIREYECNSAAAWTNGHPSEHSSWAGQHHRDGAPNIRRLSRRGLEPTVDMRYYPEFDARTDNGERSAVNIAHLTDAETRDRYHQLVDKRLESVLTPTEDLELKHIEIRLDAEDRDPHIEARDRQLERQRAELLDAIGNLLDKLRRSSY